MHRRTDTTATKLARIDEAINWRQRRIIRDANAIATLTAQRKRLLKPRSVAVVADDLSVPEYLQRAKSEHAADARARAEISAEQEAMRKAKAEKARARAKVKEQLANTPKSELRKMPLQGQAALEAIRKG
jgi:hypothetical protein